IQPENSQPLTGNDDQASLMVDGIDRFLLKQIATDAATRPDRFTVDPSSKDAWEKSLQPHRAELARCIGATDARLAFTAPEVILPVGDSGLIGDVDDDLNYVIQRVRWPVLSDPSPQGQGLASIFGEGLLLTPKRRIMANLIVIPDADQTPEQFCGLAEGIPEQSRIAHILASSGCRVIIPTLISRHREKRNGRADLTNREYLHRAAFELGRTLAGYEVQMSLSIVDWYSTSFPEIPIGVFGYGEGGMIALFAAGLDPRIQSACVSGFLGPREESWKEPIDRNFSDLLRDFGAQELAMLVAPRTLIVETSKGPEIVLAGNGGGPAELRSPDGSAAAALLKSAAERCGAAGSSLKITHPKDGMAGSAEAVSLLLASLSAGQNNESSKTENPQARKSVADQKVNSFTITERETRLLKQIDRHNQALLLESPFVRKQFMAKLDLTSVEAYEKSAEPYREKFRNAVIGSFDLPLLPFNARSRKSWETEKWTGHEVLLDVFPDVTAYGVLLIPKDLKPGEKRPVVVCQHGLEGRPTDVFLNDNPSYHDFAAKLCERGFITFAPQNPYIFTDRFRTLQRKAQPLGKSLFSVIVPQHQQIVNWLKSQSFVDDDRIAFYGLSYGGKSAMRIPALVTDYCLSICSADFNEWVLKNASSRHNFSYIWTGEYEIFEWDLGSTFNYAEMAALICPRPFMVERGHFDGVGEDEWVGYEYAKILHLYAAQLKIGERTEIEWFVGPHTINGKGTFEFLHRHLDWPAPATNK
ncbi:MAG: alpha/beta hydrolase family protein, partial [Planctomyces sp.]